MIVKRLGIGICCALIFGSASAKGPSEIAIVDATMETCLATSGGSTPSIDHCTEEARKSAEIILNRLYNDWINQLQHPKKDETAQSAEILQRFVASQRAWLRYRDTNCNLRSISMLGGTGESNVYGHCRYVETRQRVLDLQRIRDSR